MDLSDSSNITLDYIYAKKEPSTDASDLVIKTQSTDGITITNCEIESKDPATIDHVSKAGYYSVTNGALDLVGCPAGNAGGLQTATNLTVTDNIMNNMRKPIRVTFSDGVVFSRNTITNFVANGGEIQGDNWDAIGNTTYGCWAHGGGNTGATGPNNPYAGAEWRLPVLAASSFVVGEVVTGGTSGDSQTSIASETGTHEGKGWLFLDGPLWSGPGAEALFFDASETITGSIVGSSTTDGESHAVFPYDYGDPHNSLFGTGYGGKNVRYMANTGLRGTARTDANLPDIGLLTQDYEATCSGLKVNDPNTLNDPEVIYEYDNWLVTCNFSEVGDNTGMSFGHITNSEISNNTIVYRSDSGTNASPHH